MKEKLYFGLDGDSIGRKIVAHFINDEVDMLKEFSNKIEEALFKIKEIGQSKGAEIIFCTGDSILIYGEIDRKFGEEMLNMFTGLTGCNGSVGIGRSLTSTYLGLTLAKSQGGNKAVFYENEG